MGISLGALLVRDGLLSSGDLRVAVRLQILIESQSVSLWLACMALRELRAGICSAEQLIDSLDKYSANARRGFIGELLLDSDFVSELILGRALVIAVESNTKLGEILVGLNLVPQDLIDAALFQQTCVRNGSIDYRSAVIELKTFSRKGNRIFIPFRHKLFRTAQA